MSDFDIADVLRMRPTVVYVGEVLSQAEADAMLAAAAVVDQPTAFATLNTPGAGA